jgi:hypothetical protein
MNDADIPVAAGEPNAQQVRNDHFAKTGLGQS